MADTIKLRSKVRAKLIRSQLLYGSLIAAIGISLIVYTGSTYSPAELEGWGWMVFIAGLLLIAAGLNPYRRLLGLQTQPDQIVITADAIQFTSKGRRKYTLPLCDIEEIFYVDDASQYGTAITLKHPLPEKITIHDPKYNAQKVSEDCRRKHGCDLFLPYFTEGAYEQLEEVLIDFRSDEG